MTITTLPLGSFQANCYVLTDGQSCVVIDPGGDLDALSVAPSLILLTHGHPDHIAGAAALRALTGARVLVHEGDRVAVEHPHPYMAQLVGRLDDCPVDGDLTDGQQIEVGETTLTVLHTPGHSPGGVCFLAPGVVFTGDTLFAGSVGRTDLPGGSWDILAASLKRLIAASTPDTIVHSGHGPASTMAAELADNPFLKELIP